VDTENGFPSPRHKKRTVKTVPFLMVQKCRCPLFFHPNVKQAGCHAEAICRPLDACGTGA
jgi:hypothetical protein